jgi:phosphoserine phosphatase
MRSSHGEEHENEAILHRILAVSRRLSESADLHEILALVIDAMRDLLHAERATVFEYDAEANELFTTVAHGLTGTGLSEIRMPSDAGLAGESAQRRTIINVPDAHADPRFNPEIDRESGYYTRSILTIPLVGHDGVLTGVAQVLNKKIGNFTDEDEELARALSAHAAVALRRGRMIQDRIVREKLESDLEIARQIQMSSFPGELPAPDGVEIAAWSAPAEQTGGDAYDVIDVGSGAERRIVMLLADATGHGVGPALSVTQLRSMLRMASRLGAPLEQTILHVNQQVCEDLPDGRFITAWFGELEPATGFLRMFSCGQGPLFLYRSSTGAFEEVEVDTLPLGILHEIPVAVRAPIRLAPGDLFLAPSDGIIEAHAPDGTMFGAARLQAIMIEHLDQPLTTLIDHLRAAVETHAAGEPPEDDRTIIAVRRRA